MMLRGKKGFYSYLSSPDNSIFKKSMAWIVLVSYMHTSVFSGIAVASQTETEEEEPLKIRALPGATLSFNYDEDPGVIEHIRLANPGVLINLSCPDIHHKFQNIVVKSDSVQPLILPKVKVDCLTIIAPNSTRVVFTDDIDTKILDLSGVQAVVVHKDRTLRSEQIIGKFQELVNFGTVLTETELHVHNCLNLGKMTVKGLRIGAALENKGDLKAEALTGAGKVTNHGKIVSLKYLGVSSLLNHHMVEGEDLIVAPSTKIIDLHEDSVFNVKSLSVEDRDESNKMTMNNKGDISILNRLKTSFVEIINEGQIKLNQLVLQATKILNKKFAKIIALGGMEGSATSLVNNEGEFEIVTSLLSGLVGLPFLGQLIVRLIESNLSGQLDLSHIEHLMLKAAQPLNLTSNLKTGALTLDVAGLLTLGSDATHLAQILTTKGHAKITAQTINAPFAQIDSATDLLLDAQQITLNEFASNISRFKAKGLLQVDGQNLRIAHPDMCLLSANKSISGRDIAYQAHALDLRTLVQTTCSGTAEVVSDVVNGTTQAAEYDLRQLANLTLKTKSLTVNKLLRLNNAHIQVVTGTREPGTFVNTVGISSTGKLKLEVSAPIGKLEVQGDLDLPMPTRPLPGGKSVASYNRTLKELQQVSCGGVTWMETGSIWQKTDINLDKLQHLKLTLGSFKLVSKFITQALELTSTGEVVLGVDDNNFGQITTLRDMLHVHGLNVHGRYAKLGATGHLTLTAVGQVDVGHFVLMDPEEGKFLGPWGGAQSVTDYFIPIGDDKYRATNGAFLQSGGVITVKAQQVNLDYARLFSHKKTRVESETPLRLITTEFYGNGALEIKAPKTIFDFEGIGQAIRGDETFDYLVSSPTRLEHGDEIRLLTSLAHFVGTTVHAQKLMINDVAYQTNMGPGVIVTPIPLGRTTSIHHHVLGRFFARAEEISSYQNFDSPENIVQEWSMSSHLLLAVLLKGCLNNLNVKKQHLNPLLPPMRVGGLLTVAETSLYPNFPADTGVPDSVASHHYQRTPLLPWTGNTVPVTFRLGNTVTINTSQVVGLFDLSARQMTINANISDIHGSDRRPTTVSMTVNLNQLPITQALQQIQQASGMTMPGTRTFQLTDAPFLGNVRPDTRLLPSLPLDLIMQSAIAENTGLLFHNGLSGDSLLDQIYSASRRLGGRNMTLQELNSSPEILLYYAMGQAHLFFPKETKQIRGDIDANVSITTKGQNTVNNTHLVYDDSAVFKSEEEGVTLTSQNGRKATLLESDNPESTALLSAPQGPVTIQDSDIHSKGKGRIEGKRVVEEITGNVTTEESNGKSHSYQKQTVTHTDREVYFAQGLTQYAEESHQLIGMTLRSDEDITFEGGRVEADTAFDTVNAAGTVNRKKKMISYETQNVIGVHQPTVKARHVKFDNDSVHGQGLKLVTDLLTDNTKSFILEPAKAVEFCNSTTTKIGAFKTKTIIRKYGQEVFANSSIVAKKWISTLNEDGPNTIDLTNTDLTVEEMEIAKVFQQHVIEPEHWEEIKKKTKYDTKKALAMVAAIVLTICTAGAGAPAAAAGMLTMEAVVETMALAVLSGLQGQVFSGMIMNGGNIKKTMMGMCTKESLRSIGVSAVTAGVLKVVGANVTLPAEPKGFAQLAQVNGVRAFASTVANATIGGQRLGDALQSGALNFAADTVHGTLCNQLGDSRQALGYAPHKVGHFVAGMARAGILTNGDMQAMLTAGGAAAFGHMLVEAMIPDASQLPQQLQRRSAENGTLLNGQALEIAVQDRIQLVADISRLLTTSTAILLQQNPEIALDSATSAIQHNFVPHALIAAFNNIFDSETVQEITDSETMQRIGEFLENPQALEAINYLPRAVLLAALGIPVDLALQYPEETRMLWNAINPEIDALVRFRDGVAATQGVIDQARLKNRRAGLPNFSIHTSGGEATFLSYLMPTTTIDVVSTAASGLGLLRNTAARGLSYLGNALQPVSRGAALSRAVALETRAIPLLDTALVNHMESLTVIRPQVRINYDAGRAFQERVHQYLRQLENHVVYNVKLAGNILVRTKPDLSLVTAGVTDIKNVRYITFTKQMRAQATLAQNEGTSFNLIISPNTQKISKQLGDSIYKSGGKIFEFNPSTEKMVQCIVDGNKVVRK